MSPSAEALAGQTRAGGRVLLMLSDPLNASILRSLLRGPLPVSELPNHLGAVSRTTRFNRLRDLEDLGVITRERRPGTPPVSYCSLSPSGWELLPVLRQFANWLAMAPGGPSGPDEISGGCTIKALAVAWDTTVLRWLAERPCSLTELDALSPREVTHHDIRRARKSLSAVGLITPVPSADKRQPYAPVDWARGSAGCIAAAIRWERRFLDAKAPLSSTEIETLLLLLLPMVEVPQNSGGDTCLLHVERLTDLSVAVEEGGILAYPPTFENARSNRLSGSAESWFDALIDGCTKTLRMQGRIDLTTALASGLHGACVRFAATRQSNDLDKSSIPMCAVSARENCTALISSTFTDKDVNYL